MNYSDKLKSPLWQKKRLEILKANKWKCKLCKDEETTLHVHHNSYEQGREPWEYPNSNFTVLCEHCHFEVENLKKDDDKFNINYIQIYKITTWINAPKVVFIKNIHQRITILKIYDNNLKCIQELYFGRIIDQKKISKIFKN
jgi:hypothetical protein